MGVRIFPTVNDVGGSGTGKTMSELNLSSWVKTIIGQSFVVSGFSVPAYSANLTLQVAAGEAMVNGLRVVSDDVLPVTLTANATNYIYLQLTRDGASNVSGLSVVANTSGIEPTDAVKIATAVSDASTVTSTSDSRQMLPHKAELAAFTSGVAGFNATTVAAALDLLAGTRLVEAGSNANGYYYKWENGLAICLRSHTQAQSGSLWHTASGRWDWSLPLPLSGGALFCGAVVQNPDTNTAGDSSVMANDKVVARFSSQSTVAVNYVATVYADNTIQMYAFAIGRWKS